jgi:hypothetical protein
MSAPASVLRSQHIFVGQGVGGDFVVDLAVSGYVLFRRGSVAFSRLALWRTVLLSLFRTWLLLLPGRLFPMGRDPQVRLVGQSFQRPLFDYPAVPAQCFLTEMTEAV